MSELVCCDHFLYSSSANAASLTSKSTPVLLLVDYFYTHPQDKYFDAMRGLRKDRDGGWEGFQDLCKVSVRSVLFP